MSKATTNESVQKAQNDAFAAIQHACPHCGYCPHCGRSNTTPYPYPRPYPYPVAPWPPYPSPYRPTWISQPNTVIYQGNTA